MPSEGTGDLTDTPPVLQEEATQSIQSRIEELDRSIIDVRARLENSRARSITTRSVDSLAKELEVLENTRTDLRSRLENEQIISQRSPGRQTLREDERLLQQQEGLSLQQQPQQQRLPQEAGETSSETITPTIDTTNGLGTGMGASIRSDPAETSRVATFENNSFSTPSNTPVLTTHSTLGPREQRGRRGASTHQNRTGEMRERFSLGEIHEAEYPQLRQRTVATGNVNRNNNVRRVQQQTTTADAPIEEWQTTSLRVVSRPAENVPGESSVSYIQRTPRDSETVRHSVRSTQVGFGSREIRQLHGQSTSERREICGRPVERNGPTGARGVSPREQTTTEQHGTNERAVYTSRSRQDDRCRE